MNGDPRPRNLEWLARRAPALRAAVGGKPPAPSMKYRVFAGRRGMPTLEVQTGGTPIPFHSLYDPVREASRWAESNPPPENAPVVMLGWGLGYHAIAWLKQHGARAGRVFVIEPESAFFLESLSAVRLDEIPETAEVDWVLGNDPDRLRALLREHLPEILVHRLFPLVHPAAAAYPPAAVEGMKNAIRGILDERDRALRHMASMGARCQANLIGNIPAMARAVFPGRLKNAFAGYPALIAAAGPSLDKTIGQLNRAKGRCILLAADTCHRALIEHGAAPDFVIAKDPTELNECHFAASGADAAFALAFDPQTPPSIPAGLAGPLLCLPNRNHAFHQYLPGLELEGDDILPPSPNAAVAAFHLAARMGCSPIVFTGLDLCFPSNKSHASGTALRADTSVLGNGKLRYARGGAVDEVECLEVEGVDGEKYPTIPTFLDALRTLERAIAESGIPCMDATGGGARIRGARAITIHEAINGFPPGGAAVPKAFLNPPVRDREALRIGLLEQAAYLNDIKDRADRLLDESAAGGGFGGRVRREIEGDGRLYRLLQAALERLMIEARRPGYWNMDEPDAAAARDRLRVYLAAARSACEAFAPRFEEAAGRL